MTIQRRTGTQLFTFDTYAGEVDAINYHTTGNKFTLGYRPKLSANFLDAAVTFKCAAPPPPGNPVLQAGRGKIEINGQVYTYYAASLAGCFLLNEAIPENRLQAIVTLFDATAKEFFTYAGQMYDGHFDEFLNDALAMQEYNATAKPIEGAKFDFKVLPVNEDDLTHQYRLILASPAFTHTVTGNVAELKKNGVFGTFAPKPYTSATAFNFGTAAAIIYEGFTGVHLVSALGFTANGTTKTDVLRSFRNSVSTS
jgi:hypothetical protein